MCGVYLGFAKKEIVPGAPSSIFETQAKRNCVTHGVEEAAKDVWHSIGCVFEG